MDDIPQGGSGGVPDRPDTEHDAEHGGGPGGPSHGREAEERVKTVRGGAPVAEQKAEPDDTDRGTTDPAR
ncbi:hypothetical protein [Kitasatospora sp. NPDC094015]|uniref:hypothetical protein n=1 Tax=Kitasatospora sp. NPDC094015 TaxID=3155205 RepID=UPI003324D95C